VINYEDQLKLAEILTVRCADGLLGSLKGCRKEPAAATGSSRATSR
jgi:hypothetical protein